MGEKKDWRMGIAVKEDLSEDILEELPGYAKKIPPDYKEVVYISWEEWEPGFWERPDGCSLHLNMEDAKRFVKKFADRWWYPAGDPVPVYVHPEIYENILKRKKKGLDGLRLNAYEEGDMIREGKLLFTKKRSGWITIKV